MFTHSSCDANGKPWDDVRQIVEDFGPSVRNVMLYTDPPGVAVVKQELQARLVRAFRSTQFWKGPRVLTNTQDLTSDTSHRIVCLRRRRSDEYGERERQLGVGDNIGTHDISSDHIGREVLRRVEHDEQLRRVWFGDILGSHGLSRSAAGFIYERSFLFALKQGLTLKLLPMQKCEKEWWRPHTSDPCDKCKLTAQPRDMTTGKAVMCEFNGKEDLSRRISDVKGWSLMCPVAHNNPSFDYLLVHRTDSVREAYYFQCTLRPDHDANIIKDLYRRPQQEYLHWKEYYVFISDKTEIQCSHPKVVDDAFEFYFANFRWRDRLRLPGTQEGDGGS